MGFGDWIRGVGNSIPIMGGMLSSIWGDPSQEAHQRSFDQAQQLLAQQRANQMQGRMNAMNQAALAFGPRNQMLGQMMGQQGPAMDLGPMLRNPMPDNQVDQLRRAAFGDNPPAPRYK